MQQHLQTKEIFKAKNLFSKHYLENIIQGLEHWQNYDEECKKAFEKIKILYKKKEEEFTSMNEAQLEREFIQPILEILDHKFDVED